jgi:DNA-binding response OmpR family regulator
LRYNQEKRLRTARFPMTQPYSIVSIEDDVGLFELITATLKSLPVKIHHAKTGEEALQIIPTVDADLIILDITLPDIQGWEILKLLDNYPLHLKGVIVLTGRTNPAHRVMAHFQGVTAFINKPFEPAALRRTIKQTLGID